MTDNKMQAAGVINIKRERRKINIKEEREKHKERKDKERYRHMGRD